MRVQFAVVLTVTLGLAVAGCDDGGGGSTDSDANRDFRQEMMDFVVALSEWARDQDPNFIVIPQNGQEVYSDGDAADAIDQAYFDAIDGTGREDLFYGYDDDNVATSDEDTEYLMEFLDVYTDEGKMALVTDYIDTDEGAEDSYEQNLAAGYVGFAADRRDLDTIPDTLDAAPPTNYPNGNDIAELSDVDNILYLINPGEYASKSAFLADIDATDFDLLLIDAFDDDQNLLTSGNVSTLKTKGNGAARLAIAYMSIGEAEGYRYYWEDAWEEGDPSWLDATNPAWEGNYKVRYWDEDWQDIIFGNGDAYLQKILDAGFDGVYLDIIDCFEYWEAYYE